jgi:hypothetical protein
VSGWRSSLRPSITGRARAWLCGAGALLWSAVAAPQPGAVARFAIVLANNTAPDVATLQYADDDALAVHRLLLDAGIDSRLLVSVDRATRQAHPSLASDTPATAHNLLAQSTAVRAALLRAQQAGARTEFYFFFSGHGDVDAGEGYIRLEDQRFSRGDLHQLLRSLGADRNHVIVDACSSWFMVSSKNAQGDRREPFDPALLARQVPLELGNTGFILSSAADRESHEWSRLGAGILSHEVKSGLRGAADANLDGQVSYAELAAFLQAANASITQPRLRPEPFVAPPAVDNWDSVLLSWEDRSPSARLAPGLVGHVFVENDQGERVLDAHPAHDQALRLYLPSERPLFVRDDAGAREHELAQNDPIDIPPLHAATPLLAKGAEARALERLFASPFGWRDVEQQRQRAVEAALPVRDTDASLESWRDALGYTALGTAAVGLTFATLSAITSLQAADAPQVQVPQLNHRIQTERRWALGFGGAALLAAGGWLSLELNSKGGLNWGLGFGRLSAVPTP